MWLQVNDSVLHDIKKKKKKAKLANATLPQKHVKEKGRPPMATNNTAKVQAARGHNYAAWDLHHSLVSHLLIAMLITGTCYVQAHKSSTGINAYQANTKKRIPLDAHSGILHFKACARHDYDDGEPL